MTPRDRATARRQIDKRLSALPDPDTLVRPPRGWVKAIREALGMTAEQLGQRMGVSKQRAFVLEKAEAHGGVTLESLERAAHALDCRLVYAFVPRKPLQTMAEERALSNARKQLRSTSHSMALEAQRVDAADEQAQIEALAKRLLEEPGSVLWDEQ
jgi:predicted DNA-binding mobile mystery protein A